MTEKIQERAIEAAAKFVDRRGYEMLDKAWSAEELTDAPSDYFDSSTAISPGRRMLNIVSKMRHHAEHLGKQRLPIVRALSLSCIHVNSLFCFRAFRKETSPCRCLD